MLILLPWYEARQQFIASWIIVLIKRFSIPKGKFSYSEGEKGFGRTIPSFLRSLHLYLPWSSFSNIKRVPWYWSTVSITMPDLSILSIKNSPWSLWRRRNSLAYCKVSILGVVALLVIAILQGLIIESVKSRVFLLRQLWIVNYYLKSSSSNLSNENTKTGVSREMIFQK